MRATPTPPAIIYKDYTGEQPSLLDNTNGNDNGNGEQPLFSEEQIDVIAQAIAEGPAQRVSEHGRRSLGAADRAGRGASGSGQRADELDRQPRRQRQGNKSKPVRRRQRQSVAYDRSRASEMMIVSDQLIEQLKAARIALERANAEYAAWIERTGSSHGSDTAAAIRRELKLDLLLLELNRHLAEIDRVALRPNARRQ